MFLPLSNMGVWFPWVNSRLSPQGTDRLSENLIKCDAADETNFRASLTFVVVFVLSKLRVRV